MSVAAATETHEDFVARIRAQLDAHFRKFQPVTDAINAGFAVATIDASRAQERP